MNTAAFAFDPAKHPHDTHGRWASLAGPSDADKAWLFRSADDWAKTLGKGEARALESYKGSDHYPINKLLRHPDWPSTPLDHERYGNRKTAVETYGDFVPAIDAALARSRLDRSVTVHRGVSAAASGLCEAFDKGTLTPGTEITDAGYGSTSLDPKAATSFKKGWGRSGAGAVLHVALSEGDHAAHLGNAVRRRFQSLMDFPLDPDRDDGEYELVLPRNTTYRVLRTYEQGGLRHIDCAVVRQEPVAAFYDEGQARDERGRWASGGSPGESAATHSPGFKNWFGDWQNDPAHASKVVDASGKPLVVYHGTPHTFDTFDVGVGKDLGGFGFEGVFFSASHEVASSYSRHQSVKAKQLIREYERAAEDLDAFKNRIAERTNMVAPDRDGNALRWLNDLLDGGGVTREEYDHYDELRSKVWHLENKELSDEDAATTPTVMPCYLNLRNPKIVDAHGMGWDLVVPEHMASVDRTKHDGIIFKNIRDSGDASEVVTDNYVIFRPNQAKRVDNAGTFDPQKDHVGFYDGSEARDDHGRWATASQPPATLGEVDRAPHDAVYDAMDWSGRLSREEQAAIRLYTGRRFRAINQFLRDPSAADYTAEDAQAARDIVAALNRFQPTQFQEPPLKSYRGVTSDDPAKIARLKESLDAALAGGHAVTFAGLSSASADPLYAANWSQKRGPGFVLELESRRGVYIDHLSKTPGELEILHNAGATFKVTGVRTVAYQSKGQTRHVTTYALKEVKPSGSAAEFWNPDQARDERGRWAVSGGESEGGTTETPPVPTPTGPAAEAPAEPVAEDIVSRLVDFYNRVAAAGPHADEKDLETWRYGMWAHHRHDLHEALRRLGLAPADGEPSATPATDLAKALYAKLGREYPHTGDNIESRAKLAEARALLAAGAGREKRSELIYWLRHEAETDQVNWLAQELGVLPRGAPEEPKYRDGEGGLVQKLSELLIQGTRHPGEEFCEDAGLPRAVKEATTSKSSTPVLPQRVARELDRGGAPAADYMVRVLGLYQPGMTYAQKREAVVETLRAAADAHGRTPQSEAALADVRGATNPAGKITDWLARHKLRRDLDKLTWQEVGYLHRALGLVGTRDNPPLGLAAAKEVVTSVTPHITERMKEDAESAAVVKRLVEVHDAVIAKQEADIERTRVIGQEMLKWYEAADKSGPMQSAEREAWKALPENVEWKAKVDEMGRETERILEAVGRARLDDRRNFHQAMGKPKNPLKWKVKNDRPTAAHKMAMETAVEFFDLVLSRPDRLPAPAKQFATITLRPTKTRARAQKHSFGDAPAEGFVWLRDGSEQTAVHELGHHVECHSPGVKEACQDFLAHRVGDEPPQSLAKLFKDHGYSADEKGRQDDFGRYFGANDHRAYYCGKHYESGHTEILSMGCEYLFKDPLGFAKADPEYAAFVIGVLRGTLR